MLLKAGGANYSVQDDNKGTSFYPALVPCRALLPQPHQTTREPSCFGWSLFGSWLMHGHRTLFGSGLTLFLRRLFILQNTNQKFLFS